MAIEKQGDRTVTAIDKLAQQTSEVTASVGQLATAIKYGFKSEPGERNGRTALFGMACIVFGLMAPMYIMVESTGGDLTDHELLHGHPDVSSRLAALQVSLQEIETQFRGVNERITLERRNQDDELANITKQLDIDSGRELQDTGLFATLVERVRHLEREAFGIGMVGDGKIPSEPVP